MDTLQEYPANTDESSSRTNQTAVPCIESMGGATVFVEIPGPLHNHNHERIWQEKALRSVTDVGHHSSKKAMAHASNKSIPFFPASDLPDELLYKMASFLDIPSLNSARCVNRKFQVLMSRDEAGWLNHCHSLWSQRLHVSPLAKCWAKNVNHTSPFPCREAYMASCMDASRNEITEDELCYDPSSTDGGTIWSFRFKESAGFEWTGFDPWHMGEEERKMVFLRDGRVLQIVDNGGSDRQLRRPFFDAMDATGLEVRWRKVTMPLIDAKTRDGGVCIRLEIDGRDVPTYLVRRHRSNWGFLMENCWGVFASFPLPRKPQSVAATVVPTSTISTTVGLGMDSKVVNPSSAQSSTRPTKRRKLGDGADLLSDSSLAMTSSLQWREALLYNLGASSLPDGTDAAENFSRGWQIALWLLQGRSSLT